jgi:raffinose/stachyose/melibiose transport system permease protein
MTTITQAPPTPPTERIATRTARRKGFGISPWFAFPALAFFTAIVAIPTILGVYYAFTNWDGISAAPSFIGFDNFVALFKNPETIQALGNTLLMAVVITIVQNAIGLALAAGVNSRIKSRNVLRTFLFAPVVMTPIIVGYLWQFLFIPNGPIASLAKLVGIPNLNMLGDPATAIWGVIIVVIWQHAGYSMVIFLAGMQGIPEEITEAAALDGAGAWKRFAHITWPLLRTPLVINITLSLIMSFKLFDQVMATTQGGPGYSTQTLSTLLYFEAFQFNQFSSGIALGVVVFLLTAVISFTQMRLFRDRNAT